MDKQTEKQTITPEKTITEYYVVSETNCSIVGGVVNERLKKNWHLYGNLIVTSYRDDGQGYDGLMYIQALVKYN